MNYQNIITIEPGKRSGKPCIRGMRITVYDILEYLAGGMTEAEIIEDFSELTLEDIKACLAFAADREKKLFVASLWNCFWMKTFQTGLFTGLSICILALSTSKPLPLRILTIVWSGNMQRPIVLQLFQKILTFINAVCFTVIPLSSFIFELVTVQHRASFRFWGRILTQSTSLLIETRKVF